MSFCQIISISLLVTLVSFQLFIIIKVDCKEIIQCESGSMSLTIEYDLFDPRKCYDVLKPYHLVKLLEGTNKTLYNVLQFCFDGFPKTKNYCKIKCSEYLNKTLEEDIKCSKRYYTYGNGSSIHGSNGVDKSRNPCNNTRNYERLITQCDFENGSEPKILNDSNNTEEVKLYRSDIKLGKELLRCDFNGTFDITVRWERSSKLLVYSDQHFEIKTDVLIGQSVSFKIITKKIVEYFTPENHHTRWKCIGQNVYDEGWQEFDLEILEKYENHDDKPDNWKQVVGIGIGFILAATLTIFILITLHKCWWGKRFQFTKKEIEEFKLGSTVIEGLINNYPLFYERFRSDPYDRILEININDLSIDKKCLGKGAFGEVYLGKYKGELAAVKTPQKTKNLEKTKEYIQSLLTEIKVLNFVNGHRNIVNLIGAYTNELRKGKVFVLTEFCPYGSLDSRLKEYRLNKANSYMEFVDSVFSVDLSVNQEPSLSSEESQIEVNHNVMLNWALQIASGMEWLGSKNVVHGDLATRNILLSTPETVKITDFGLSIKLYDLKMKQLVKDSKMPWRWMPVETLKNGIVSPLGDIWSFGICLWEIYSLALVPYAGISECTLEVVTLLENGSLRNSQPPDTPNAIYEIMNDCWRTNTGERPSFKLLREKLYLESHRFLEPTVYVDFNELNN